VRGTRTRWAAARAAQGERGAPAPKPGLPDLLLVLLEELPLRVAHVDAAPLDIGLLDGAGVLQRITRGDQECGIPAHLQRPHTVVDPEESRGIEGDCLQRLGRRQPEGDRGAGLLREPIRVWRAPAPGDGKGHAGGMQLRGERIGRIVGLPLPARGAQHGGDEHRYRFSGQMIGDVGGIAPAPDHQSHTFLLRPGDRVLDLPQLIGVHDDRHPALDDRDHRFPAGVGAVGADVANRSGPVRRVVGACGGEGLAQLGDLPLIPGIRIRCPLPCRGSSSGRREAATATARSGRRRTSASSPPTSTRPASSRPRGPR
jgi:hypothetical protein